MEASYEMDFWEYNNTVPIKYRFSYDPTPYRDLWDLAGEAWDDKGEIAGKAWNGAVSFTACIMRLGGVFDVTLK
jgi:hypothetical protein